ncbi:hypothetical protein SRABI27_01080 [Pedobacter sp. Bi27]|uniref:hypothetical protein n=2 Tax=Pseudomonadati TaxID=3379134 RepID=UPI001D71139D|nr:MULTISPECIES: hypothetical protein [unclassified Pedobacter]CAH0173223.1 hypothetical protein SRABI126_01083 [Pedobacter sp. Bi126]CAH0173623.1 hypothetical protein SRABI27_01080 [Pedobacter sp. Bi27]CAH0290513.1 hypothetical protein SRABI36_04293 [Pedobacter sp. Bi36]
MKKIILLSVLTLLGSIVKAQRNFDDFFNPLSFGLELGAATLQKPLVSGFIAYNKPGSYLKFKISSVMQESYEVNVNGEETTMPGFSEVALMLGKRVKINSNHRIEFGGGVALIADLKKYDESNSDTTRDKIIQKNSVGLVAEARYIFRFVDGVGISLSVNGNANRQKTFATAGLGLVFGSKKL